MNLPEIIRQNDVAKLLEVSKTSVQRYAKRGLITPIRDGRKVCVSREQVIGLFERRTKK